MARKTSNRAAESLRELEATGDRLTQWVSDNATLILGTIAGILVLAGGAGLWIQHSANARDLAANALALTTSDYRRAMGADPGGGPIQEPANAELAERTRSDFALRFEAVGREHIGTPSGAIAMLEAGGLRVQLGELEAATVSFEAARQSAGASAISALAAVRLAGLSELRGHMATAAEAYAEASEVEEYPLRAEALAEAARCWAAAKDTDRALAAYQRLESEFPDQRPAPQIESLLAELRLRGRP